MRNYQGATWWAILRHHFGNKCGRCEKTAPLKPSRHWIVHHKDGNHDNNEIGNLELLCRKCHSLLHQPSQYTKRKNREVTCPRCDKKGTIHKVGRGFICIYHGKSNIRRSDGRGFQDIRHFMRLKDLEKLGINSCKTF